MNSKILVVLGMHRSGTSLISQWLYKCGLNLGDNLMGAAIGNEEGHFEDYDFVNLHEEILKSKNLPALALTENALENLSSDYTEKIKRNIQVKTELYKQWGWKDPRTCLFLTHYRNILGNTKYIIILRDWRSVVNSLLKKKFKQIESYNLTKGTASKILWKIRRRKRIKTALCKQNSEAYLKMWINYNEALLNHIKLISPDDFILINYNMMNSHSQAVFNHIHNQWLFDLMYYDYEKVLKKNLIDCSKDVPPFVHDKLLIDRACSLGEELQKFSFIQ